MFSGPRETRRTAGWIQCPFFGGSPEQEFTQQWQFKEPDDSSQEGREAARRALANKRISVPPVRNKRENRLRAADRNRRLVDTAFEILVFQAYGNSSSSNIVRIVQPLCSTGATLPRKVQTAVAFDIPVGGKKTVCPPAKVPRRFRKRKVASESTLEEVMPSRGTWRNYSASWSARTAWLELADHARRRRPPKLL